MVSCRFFPRKNEAIAPSAEVMRYLVESGVDVTGDVGDLLLETAAPLMQALGGLMEV